MSETDLKNKVLRYLRRELPGSWVYHPSDKFVSGIPDILVVWRGRFMAIELKVGKNKPTRIQLHTLKKIEEACGMAFVCYTMEEVKEAVAAFMVPDVIGGEVV